MNVGTLFALVAVAYYFYMREFQGGYASYGRMRGLVWTQVSRVPKGVPGATQIRAIGPKDSDVQGGYQGGYLVHTRTVDEQRRQPEGACRWPPAGGILV